jgi:hypothetical protein
MKGFCEPLKLGRYSGASFSLTPTLSPRRGGWRRSSLEHRDTKEPIIRRRMYLPLPRGEGRGEGNRGSGQVKSLDVLRGSLGPPLISHLSSLTS